MDDIVHRIVAVYVAVMRGSVPADRVITAHFGGP